MELPANKKPFVIGIAGGSGSGKTFFLKSFLHHFNEGEVCLVSQDNYYKPKSLQKVDENGWVNFDLPEGIDETQLVSDIKTLINGKIVQKKEYTFNIDEEKARVITLTSCPIIVVEGLFIFHFKELASLIDSRIFIDAEEEVTLNRRIKRDGKERGYDRDMVMYQWFNHVLPAYRQYLLPYKSTANKIIMNNSYVADDIIEATEKISKELKESILTTNS